MGETEAPLTVFGVAVEVGVLLALAVWLLDPADVFETPRPAWWWAWLSVLAAMAALNGIALAI